jgi:methionine sulfoxide reductase heme-binding subunit
MARARWRPRAVTASAWLIGLAPLLLLSLDVATGNLSADPVEELTHRTGWWALLLLLLTLAITPARRISGLNELIRARRPLGIFAFLLASLHLLIYFVLDQGLTVSFLVEDILERPFITVGFLAWLLLVPLAVTSTTGWIRRLGRNWRRLHRLVYLAAALGVLHFAWGVKADLREPMIFAGALAILLLFRVIFARSRRRPSLATRAPADTGGTD